MDWLEALFSLAISQLRNMESFQIKYSTAITIQIGKYPSFRVDSLSYLVHTKEAATSHGARRDYEDFRMKSNWVLSQDNIA